MEKYYKPDISEFHVGFEYEERIENDEWESRVFETEDDFNLCTNNTQHTRVKYLDKEDIESLGFETGKTNGIRNWYHAKQNSKYFGERLPAESSYSFWEITIIHDPKYNWLQIKAKTSDGEWYTFFEGIIKNKSELKKLLKQVGIDYVEA